MKEEIMKHIKNSKEQGINVRVDEDQINNDKKDEKNKYIDSEIDRFLDKCDDKYENKNIYISCNKNKFNTEEITKSLKILHKKLINFSEFNEEYNKFMDNVIKFEHYKSEKEPGSVSPNQKKNEKICKMFKRYCRSL